MLTTECKSKIVKLFSRGQTHKIESFTDAQNMPRVRYYVVGFCVASNMSTCNESQVRVGVKSGRLMREKTSTTSQDTIRFHQVFRKIWTP